jgi:hypothetical protein
MSGEHAKKEMVTGEKPATSHGKAPSGESHNNKKEESPPHKSHQSGEKKKKMKKVVYYETDSSSPSTSSSDAPSITYKRHERKKFSKIPLRYLLGSCFVAEGPAERKQLRLKLLVRVAEGIIHKASVF